MKLTRDSLKALICVVGWEAQNDVKKKFEKNHELNSSTLNFAAKFNEFAAKISPLIFNEFAAHF